MSQIKPTLLVLAAGIGSRYGSLKQVDKLGPSGETIIDYSIYDAIRAGFGKVVFVIRKSIEAEFREVTAKFSRKISIDFSFQELDNVPEGIKVPAERQKPWGTGHAVLVAANKIDTPFAVINADDFYGAQSYKVISDYLTANHNSDKDKYCMVGYHLKNTLSENGHVARGVCEISENHLLKSVVERTQIIRQEENIVFKDSDESWKTLSGEAMVSMNFWGFPASVFKHLEKKFKSFILSNYQNPKAEFYIPLAINELLSENEARVKVLSTPDSWFGVTYKEDKESSIKKLNSLIANGVYPKKLWEVE
jgi:UTP-glucose-1-phosphate uridylyltransferase